jgi:CRISPR system Cascade subunit CasE
MNAFPDNLEEINEGYHILFRINKNFKSQFPSVLIQSTLKPDWTGLIRAKNYLVQDPHFKEFEFPRFWKGAEYWFQLFGNPTKKTGGKRVGMYKEENQYKWLQKKAEAGGFRLLQGYITRKEEIKARVDRSSKEMTFVGVQFNGLLKILDPEQFSMTLINGIGSGKAFGFGFLTIARY